jgi:hypothetical protein
MLQDHVDKRVARTPLQHAGEVSTVKTTEVGTFINITTVILNVSYIKFADGMCKARFIFKGIEGQLIPDFCTSQSGMSHLKSCVSIVCRYLILSGKFRN